MNHNISDPLFDMLKKYVGDKMTEQIERDRRIAEREQKEEESRESGLIFGYYFSLAMFILVIFTLLGHLAYYIWKRMQSGKAGPITQTAIAPNEEKLILYTGNPYCEHDTSNARIWMWAKNNFQNKASAKLDNILKIGCNLKDVKENLLPTYTRLISIKMDGFNHEERCYEFVPIDGEAIGSRFTYQIYGNNRIQVTNYVIGGKSYVAGFCIFVGPKDLFWEAEYNVNVVKKLMKSEKYPGRDALKKEGGIIVEEENTEETQIPTGFSIQYCRLLQRKVITIEEHGVLSHQEWDKFEKKMKTEECKTCTENLLPPNYPSFLIV
ncbi:unnamed protein product [Caenorhabditis brenneri]